MGKVGKFQCSEKSCWNPEVILSAMEAILSQAAESGHWVLFIGDVNSAPKGGRWGHSPSKRLARVDNDMCEWVSRHCCREIQRVKLQATWVACQDIQQAILDRAFTHPAQELSSPLTVAWNRAVFDHALKLSVSSTRRQGSATLEHVVPRVPT
jgi:hypothetical protein